MLALAFYRDWQLTLVIFTVSPLFLIIFQRAGKRIRGHQKAVQENLASMTHNVNEGIAAQKVSKAFNLEKFMIDRFKKSQDQYFRFQMKSTKVEELTSPLVEFVGAIAFAGVIVFAHHRIKMGAMTTGDFVSFFTALVFFMDPIRKISRANLKINQARAAADRVFEIMEVETEKNTGTRPIKEFKDKIEFRNITFSYGENTVLKNFSLTISKGEKVALVGLSGSGKSTLINLALRLYPLDSGEIYLDGYPIEEYELHELRSLFGLVSQDIFLFNDTILENLTLGNKALEVGVEQALEVAYAREFVEEMPAKLETVIGDRGMRLSGGQAQRITIARAFLQDSPVLLFDEATSALDNESEKVVQAALDKLAQDRTVLAVAHRLSTIQNFDKIVVLQSGKIMEEGHHRDLMQSNGEYRKLYELSSMP
jgi:subfamily B ATP-binding cassette protein MsbA